MGNQKEIEYPLVSCITTTFNKFEYIYQTLDSIFMQDYPNIELLVSDDGSDSFPESKIIRYIEEHKRENIRNVIYNFHQENLGTVRNSNLNRSLASGKYYIGIGSDDYLYDKKVVTDVVNYFERTGAKIVTCQRQLISEEGAKKLGVMPFKTEEKYFERLSPQEQFYRIASFNYISGACTYMRADFFREIGGLDETYKYFEDYPTYLRLLRNGQKIDYYRRISVCYRFGVGQSTMPNKKNPYKYAIYSERIKAIEKDIIPFYGEMEWWRKKHIDLKRISYQVERDGVFNSQFKKYLYLFKRSPIGTCIQVWYQLYYRRNTNKGQKR